MSIKVNRGRTLARSQALQLLFQAEALMCSLDEVLEGDYLLSQGPLEPYALELVRGCYAHLDRIDSALCAVSQNWELSRMPGSDRNLLRLAIYEMRLADEPIEDAVVINEAVEIAKAYGTDESAGFVNGVLGEISRAEELPDADRLTRASSSETSEGAADAADQTDDGSSCGEDPEGAVGCDPDEGGDGQHGADSDAFI
ncbi:NusB antitermination factor [Coriobacterium glomerans PW2]|uniref:Transcription antitermination protein NusB n=1 Tax=Coriobacterium glomerans (strain ATCC 49209 / DSM 20642 / JCM 10262 / PW2) TaxID=700015 RepID=F2N7Z2_CORGP|nr:transcription antitermination factor NusB [Coriobacterium glomerans]AEB07101.1 NusB antitermination factor [Coriobacterium glomerans PW2]